MANYCITEKTGKEYSKVNIAYLRSPNDCWGVCDPNLPVILRGYWASNGLPNENVYTSYNSPLFALEDCGDYLSLTPYKLVAIDVNTCGLQMSPHLIKSYNQSYRYVKDCCSASDSRIQFRFYKNKTMVILHQIKFDTEEVVYACNPKVKDIPPSMFYRKLRWTWSCSTSPAQYGSPTIFAGKKDIAFKEAAIIINSDEEAKAAATPVTKTIADGMIKDYGGSQGYPGPLFITKEATEASVKFSDIVSKEVTQFFDISALTKEDEIFIFEQDGTKRTKTDANFFISLQSMLRFLCVKPSMSKKSAAIHSSVQDYIEAFGGDVDFTLKTNRGYEYLRIARKDDTIIFHYSQESKCNKVTYEYTRDCIEPKIITYDTVNHTYKMFMYDNKKKKITEAKNPTVYTTLLRHIYPVRNSRKFKTKLYGISNFKEAFKGTILGACFDEPVASAIDNLYTMRLESTPAYVLGNRIEKQTGKTCELSAWGKEGNDLPLEFITLLAADCNQTIRESFYSANYSIFSMLYKYAYVYFINGGWGDEIYNCSLADMKYLSGTEAAVPTCQTFSVANHSIVHENNVSLKEFFGGASEEQIQLINSLVKDKELIDVPLFCRIEAIAGKQITEVTDDELKILCQVTPKLFQEKYDLLPEVQGITRIVFEKNFGRLIFAIDLVLTRISTKHKTAPLAQKIEALVDYIGTKAMGAYIMEIWYNDSYAKKVNFLNLFKHETVLCPFSMVSRTPCAQPGSRHVEVMAPNKDLVLVMSAKENLQNKHGLKLRDFNDVLYAVGIGCYESTKAISESIQEVLAHPTIDSSYYIKWDYPRKIMNTSNKEFILLTPRNFDDIVAECCSIGIIPSRIHDYLCSSVSASREESPVYFIRKASDPKKPYGIIVNDNRDEAIAILTEGCLTYQEMQQEEKIKVLKAMIELKNAGGIKISKNFITASTIIALGGK